MSGFDDLRGPPPPGDDGYQARYREKSYADRVQKGRRERAILSRLSPFRSFDLAKTPDARNPDVPDFDF